MSSSSGPLDVIPPQFPAFLHYHPSWRKDRDHSSIVTRVLRSGFSSLESAKHLEGDVRKQKYRKAIALTSEHVQSPTGKSHRQYVRVLLIHAESLIELGDFLLAQGDLTIAVEIAERLDRDTELLARLYWLRGRVYLADLRLRDAAKSFRLAIRALDLLDNRFPDFRLQVLINAAGVEIYCGRRKYADAFLREAEQLSTLLGNLIFDYAKVKWYQAILNLFTHHLTEAEANALIAANIFTDHKSYVFANRAQTTACEAILRSAERLPVYSKKRENKILNALRHQQTALALASDTDDTEGRCLAELANIRASQMLNIEDGRIGILGYIIAIGEEKQDAALISQAYTVLGIELEIRGRIDSAKLCFEHAVNAAQKADLRALEQRPRTYLLQLQEQYL